MRYLIPIICLLSCVNISFSQYYNLSQINIINSNKTAYEGDFYMDTIAKRYFIGVTTGEVVEIGVEVDSVKVINDSIVIYQGSGKVSTPFSAQADNQFDITQTSHGFTIPSWGILPLSYNTTSNLYVAAQGDNTINSASLLAISIKNANTLTIQNTGYLDLTHGLDIGYWWLLDRINPGQIMRSDTASCDTNEISQTLFFTATANKILIQPEQPIACLQSAANSSPGGGTGGTPTTLAACPSVISTFFNEQQYSWGFNIQNNTGSPISQWQLIINNANYQLNSANISNNNQFTYVEVNNGNGTYNHYFTSTGGLASGGTSSNYQYAGGVNFGFSLTSVSKTYNCSP